MNQKSLLRFSSVKAAAAVLMLVALAQLHAQTLVHRYNFDDGTANDTFGTANGTLQASGTISGGVLATTAASSLTSGVSLPVAATASLTGSFTIESWFTLAGFNNYAVGFSFGSTTTNFLIGSPERAGGHFVGVGILNNLSVQSTTAPALSSLYQFVTTYDSTTGLVSVYLNGNTTPIITRTVAGFNLSSTASATFAGGINGSPVNPYGDPSINGSTDDFRIYDGALSASQVASIYAFGSDATLDQLATVVTVAPVPEPSVVALFLGSLGLLLLLRRLRGVAA